MAEQQRKLTIRSETVGAEEAAKGIDKITEAEKELGEAVDELQAKLKQQTVALEEDTAAKTRSGKAVDTFKVVVTESAEGVGWLSKALSALLSPWTLILLVAGRFFTVLRGLGPAITLVVVALGILAKSIADVTRAWRQAIAAQQEFTKQARTREDIAEAARTMVVEVMAEIGLDPGGDAALRNMAAHAMRLGRLGYDPMRAARIAAGLDMEPDKEGAIRRRYFGPGARRAAAREQIRQGGEDTKSAFMRIITGQFIGDFLAGPFRERDIVQPGRQDDLRAFIRGQFPGLTPDQEFRLIRHLVNFQLAAPEFQARFGRDMFLDMGQAGTALNPIDFQERLGIQNDIYLKFVESIQLFNLSAVGMANERESASKRVMRVMPEHITDVTD